jgi:tetratricopeptide (TPR) repeat protein
MNKSMQIVLSLLVTYCAAQLGALAEYNDDPDSDLLAANRLPRVSTATYVKGVINVARNGSRKDYAKLDTTASEELANVWQVIGRDDLASLIKDVNEKAYASYQKHDLQGACDRLYCGLDGAAMFSRSLSWGNGHLEGVELKQAKPLIWLDSFAELNTELPGLTSDRTCSFKGTQYLAAVNNYAYYLQLQGKHSEAIPILQKIVEIDPERTVAYLNLADSLWAMGKKSEAGQCYAEYLSSCQKEHFDDVPGRVKQRYLAKAY